MKILVMKILLLILVALYVLSPTDLVPGPVDDIIVILLTIASRKSLTGIGDGTDNI